MRSSDHPAVLLVGHGSKTRGFDHAMQRVAKALRKKKDFFSVRCAFLEVAAPSIPEGIAQAVEKGAKEVRVLPYFVLTGKHVTRDIPNIVAEASRKYRGHAKIILCPYLGFDEKIVSVVKKRLSHG